MMHFELGGQFEFPQIECDRLHSISQMVVGLLYVIIGSMNINRTKEQRAATILNDIILVLVFTVSLINVIISGFGMEFSSQPLRLLDQERPT